MKTLALLALVSGSAFAGMDYTCTPTTHGNLGIQSFSLNIVEDGQASRASRTSVRDASVILGYGEAAPKEVVRLNLPEMQWSGYGVFRLNRLQGLQRILIDNRIVRDGSNHGLVILQDSQYANQHFYFCELN